MFAAQPVNSRKSLENQDYAHLAGIRVMTRDDDLRVRLGRVRDRGSARRAKPFIAQALARSRESRRPEASIWPKCRSSSFGRGRAASVAAAHGS